MSFGGSRRSSDGRRSCSGDGGDWDRPGPPSDPQHRDETRVSVALRFFPFPGGRKDLQDSSDPLEQQADDLWITVVLTGPSC